MSTTLIQNPPAILALETGDIFQGFSIGASGSSYGELIFNTSMTGYQEILTDPSYRRQTIVMTYPEIGNYGIHPDENESDKIHASGLVVKNYYPYQEEDFSHNPRISLTDFLKKHNTPAITGVDTRKITKIIRDIGVVKSVITTEAYPDEVLIKMAKESQSISDFDCIAEVTTKKTYQFNPTTKQQNTINQIVVLDFGVKKSILNYLKQQAKQITVLPAYSSIEEILHHQPDGIMLSNGPGDPNTFRENGLQTIKKLIGKVPIFGICFGHQVLLKSLGKSTYKLKFGHHAANHPVKNLFTNKVSITSQNHNYAAGEALKPEEGLSYINLNDQTVAGYKNDEDSCFSVQYHPEAAPGPHDSLYLFDYFFQMIKDFKKK